MKSAQGMRRVYVRPDIRPEIQLFISNSGQAGSSKKEGKRRRRRRWKMMKKAPKKKKKKEEKM